MTTSDLKKKKTKLSISQTATSPLSVPAKSSNSSTPAESSNSSLPESVEPLTISTPSQLPTENTSLAETTIKERKKHIMEHLKKSSDDFQYFSADYKERSSKIREHIQKSLS